MYLEKEFLNIEAMKKYDINCSLFYRRAKPYEKVKKGKPNE
ncbi:hypothetical protein B4147_0179 [Bacillus wiedmannii]|uniref:Uncharacterized protein n=1 Tax=Bacillus wiedmannii TaxID=1890302 RepID=A0A0G8BVA7_9BACI|nr:hypothetical protein B4147_0179 [Bacillus wiedmannii]